MHIQTPKPPRLLGFRLTVYPSPQFLQINGRFYHASPASLCGRRNQNSAWPLRSVHITRLHCYYGPLRHPAAFGPFPVSAVIGPTFSRNCSLGHTGLLQFLSSPCYRVAAITPPV